MTDSPESNPPAEKNIEKQSTQKPLVLKDDHLATKAYLTIQKIYFKHAQDAYLEVANYLAKTFFNNDIELIRSKTPIKDKASSFNMLIQRLKEEDAGLPKKTWLYNCLGLLADKNELENKEGFRTYGNLSVSHKIQLLPIHDLEQKKELICEIEEFQYSVRALKDRVKKVRSRKTTECVEDDKEINCHLFRLQELEKYFESGKSKIYDMIASTKENAGYKQLDKQLDELIDSISKMIAETITSA